jgi:hypothetical protein
VQVIDEKLLLTDVNAGVRKITAIESGSPSARGQLSVSIFVPRIWVQSGEATASG